MRKKRSTYEIYLEILEAIAIRGYNTITKISYQANMPINRAKETINILRDKGFIREESIGGKRIYYLTARGGELLHALKTVKKYMG